MVTNPLDGEASLIDKVCIYSCAAAVLLVVAGPAMAKQKTKKTAAEPAHIYTQVECMKVKKMHWDDATQTCQKNK
jgi:hypothetical protein